MIRRAGAENSTTMQENLEGLMTGRAESSFGCCTVIKINAEQIAWIRRQSAAEISACGAHHAQSDPLQLSTVLLLNVSTLITRMDDEVIKNRQAGFSIFAGVVFAAGWWIFIDGFNMGSQVLKDSASVNAQGYAWLPLFGATMVFLMLNGMKWSELDENNVTDPRTSAKARIFLVFTMFLSFVCIGGSAFLMADKFLRAEGAYQWAGISCLVGTLTILLSAFIMRYGTLPPAV